MAGHAMSERSERDVPICADCDRGVGWAIRFKSGYDGRVRLLELETQTETLEALEHIIFRDPSPEWIEFHLPDAAHAE